MLYTEGGKLQVFGERRPPGSSAGDKLCLKERRGDERGGWEYLVQHSLHSKEGHGKNTRRRQPIVCNSFIITTKKEKKRGVHRRIKSGNGGTLFRGF